jgi:HPt (histidine-containing phosphotransfer) domain-containing protein
MLAHQLKGAAGGYGFPTITQAAKDCEATAKDHENMEALDQQVRQLADLCRKASARSVPTT